SRTGQAAPGRNRQQGLPSPASTRREAITGWHSPRRATAARNAAASARADSHTSRRGSKPGQPRPRSTPATARMAASAAFSRCRPAAPASWRSRLVPVTARLGSLVGAPVKDLPAAGPAEGADELDPLRDLEGGQPPPAELQQLPLRKGAARGPGDDARVGGL